ncbi:MAG: hypothetical protein QOI16_231 [Pseudonocardiales bacterium]|nr:hypothetical protein [Pseudonocardiales bacterium]
MGVIGRSVGAVLAVAVTAGCAAPATHTAADGSDFDDADVTFASSMVPHHSQAIVMAKMAPAHGASAHVRELAQQISAEQVPEIVQMQTMLADWGRPAAPTASMTPTGGMAGMGGMGGGDAGQYLAQGMMTDQEMQALTAASGPAFDRLFLQGMIQHHQGAVVMAKTELADGDNTDAQVLAENISDTQLAQITLMQQLLTSG